MESSSSFSSSPKHNPKVKCMGGDKVGSNCLMLLSSPLLFTHSPLVTTQLSVLTTQQSPKPNLQLQLQLQLQHTLRIVRDFHNSFLSTADKCHRFFDSFVSKTPLLHNLFSFSSHLHNFCQIRCRNNGNLNSLANHNFAAILPGDSVAGIVVANGILNFLNIYNTLLVVRLVLTWFPNTPPAIVSPLSTLCDPYLNIFRGIIPPLGGLDLSPILAFLVLNVFTSTASALPAELPSTEVSNEIPSSCSNFVSHLTTSQKKWAKRFSGNRSKNSGTDS